ncbi:hypothetical protein SAMN04489712_111246 [Thermomonospora echinospora]|uniref:Uncharacterized protein n=1 Tax=Thermomonospora echinospora TaxID=1992 RepID=A0A1H6CX51_9ACTN|nr:hypothetical protein [Thermomonospora echinospora]SEG77085.1 hypothetical protein SAMN04489712_111246 [Thermomonospora echinospora]
MKVPAAGPSRTAFVTAADDLADRVLSALRGAENAPFLARHVEQAPDRGAALAAVRLVGADVFVPHLLAGFPLDGQDAAAVTRSLAVFPQEAVIAGAGDAGSAVAWRDWAVAELLTRFDGGRPAVPPGEEPAEDPAATGWRPWCARMAGLSPLAIAGLDGPVHQAARCGALPLSRGAARSMLRRDYLTAVRLIRWLAWLHHDGVPLPLDLEAALDHAVLLGGHGPRTALDIAVAERLLGRPDDAHRRR